MDLNNQIISELNKVPVPRIDRTKKYTLAEILFLVLSAALSECNTWTSMVEFGKNKLDWLRKFLPFTNGIPSDDTIARVMRIIDTKALQFAFEECTKLIIEFNSDIIPLDGKTKRRSHDSAEDKSALHVVSAYCKKIM